MIIRVQQEDFDIAAVNRLRKGEAELLTLGDLLAFGDSERCLALMQANRPREGVHAGRIEPGGASRERRFELLRRLRNWARNTRGLHRALGIMAEVYHSGDAGWSARDYQFRQRVLNEKFADWISLPSLLRGAAALLPWWSDRDDRVKDNTLALLVVLEQLTAGEEDDSALRIELRVPAGSRSRRIRLV